MSIWFKMNGEVIEVSPKNDKFTLEEMQSYVGGNIEIVPNNKNRAENFKNHIFLVNENGLPMFLPENKNASFLNDISRSTPQLLGNVLVCSPDEFNNE